LHTVVSGNDISDGIIANMAHMKVAAGVGKHRQAVEFFFVGVLSNQEAIMLLPIGLSDCLYFLRGILGVNTTH